MGYNTESYKNIIWLLLPLGPLWRRNESNDTGKTVAAIADEFARVDSRARDLLAEFPATATELLPEWEAAVALPDECTGGLAETLPERRLAVVARLTDTADNSRQGLVDLLARAGFAATVEEYADMAADVDPYYPAGQREHVWRVTVTDYAEAEYFEAGIGKAGDPLQDFRIPALECLVNRSKPAHTLALFAYTGTA